MDGYEKNGVQTIIILSNYSQGFALMALLYCSWPSIHRPCLTTQVFDNLLRACPESKKALLTWIVSCLESNKDRGKMASRLSRAFAFHQAQASDGFFVNLSWVMLRLCSPFLISDNNDSTRTARIRTVDITYVVCDKSRAAYIDSGGPLVSFSEDPKLVPTSGLSSSFLMIPKIFQLFV